MGVIDYYEDAEIHFIVLRTKTEKYLFSLFYEVKSDFVLVTKWTIVQVIPSPVPAGIGYVNSRVYDKYCGII